MISQGEAFDVIILGGGVTGLSQARDLRRDGKKVCVLEPFEDLGGNQKSWSHANYTFDIGSFFFTRSGLFLETFAEVADQFLDVQPSFGRINPRNCLLTYPIKPKELRRDLSLPELLALPFDLALNRLRYRRMHSAGDFARYYLGNLIYDRTGLKGYIERFFSSSDDKVDVDFARKRMRWIADAASISTRLRRRGVKRVESGTVKVCVRPRQGFAALYRQIGDLLRRDGIVIETGVRLTKIEPSGTGFTIHADGRQVAATRLIGTIPSEDIAALLGFDAVDPPPTLDLLTLFARAPQRLATPHDVLFNFSREGRWKRMTLHSRFYGGADHDYMSIEITSPDGSREPIQEHMTAISRQLQQTGLLREPLSLLGHEITSHAYPLYTQGVMAAAERLRSRIAACGVELAGRQGNFDYIPSADLAVKLVRLQAGANAAPGEPPIRGTTVSDPVDAALASKAPGIAIGLPD
jgi:protoporphyrinogen oxidase